MTGNNDNNNEVKPIFESLPYQVYVKEDKSGYVVLNVGTGVFEVEDPVLGKCITYADHSAEFLEAYLSARKSSKDSNIAVFPAGAVPADKSH